MEAGNSRESRKDFCRVERSVSGGGHGEPAEH